MTHLRIHLIYLVLIGFLAYQYWTKTEALHHATESIEQLDKLLKMDNAIVDKSASWIFREIEKQVRTYPSPINMSFLDKAKKATLASASINEWIESQKREIINANGGFDKKDSTVLTNRLAKNTLSEQKVQQIRDSLTRFQHVLNDISDNRSLKEQQARYATLKLLTDSLYWQELKMGTVCEVIAQLTAIQNRIVMDEIPYLNYNYNLVGGTPIIDHYYRVMIAPNKTTILEGETFKSDVFLAEYLANPTTGVTFTVNKRQLPIKEGVAYFETKATTIGKQIVVALARIRNPLTGQTITAKGEFEYEVLPKCSRDCK